MFQLRYVCALFAVAAMYVALSTVARCQDDVERMVGKWVTDKTLTLKYMEDNDQDIDGFDDLPSVAVEFNVDGTLVATIDGEPQNGTWEIVNSDDDNNWTVNLTHDEDSISATVKFLDGGAMMVQPEGEFPLVFSRAKKGDAGSLDNRLVGKWKGDAAASRDLEANKDFDEGELDGMISQIENMQLTFNEAGEFAVNIDMGEAGSMDMTGSWAVESVSDDKKTLKVNIDMEGDETMFNIVIIDADHVQLGPEGEPAAVMVRQK